jgi:hypothetical protein
MSHMYGATALKPDSDQKRVRFVVTKVVAIQATPGRCFNLLLARIVTTSAGNFGSL